MTMFRFLICCKHAESVYHLFLRTETLQFYRIHILYFMDLVYLKPPLWPKQNEQTRTWIVFLPCEFAYKHNYC